MANDELGWVSEDGVRNYFVRSDRGGPSRLECYRRMLTTSTAKPSVRVRVSPTSVPWRLANLVDLAKGGWRRYPAAIATVLHIVGQ